MIKIATIMALINAGQLQALPAQQYNAAQVKPRTKTCSDGSIILASHRCVEFPDHRKLYSLPPQVILHSIEWSCGKRKARVRLKVTEVPTVVDGQTVRKAKFEIRLLEATVSGSSLSAQTSMQIRTKVREFDQLGYLSGRCYYDDTPSLNISGFTLKNLKQPQDAEIELR